MDERRTLAILAWGIGTVVGAMFILSGIALSFVESPSAPGANQIATDNAPALYAPAVPSPRGG